MNIKKITLERNNSPVSIIIEVPERRPIYPQTIGGNIHRYNKDQVLEKKVGVFGGSYTDVPVGVPNDLDDKYFLIQGGVVSHKDLTPTFYQVSVTVRQGESVLLTEIPEKWSGELGENDIPLMYIIQTKIG